MSCSCTPTCASIKRGDTFKFTATRTDDSGVEVDLTGYTVKVQFRRGGNLIASSYGAVLQTLTVVIADQTVSPGLVTVTCAAASTTIWPVCEDLFGDIQYISPGGVVETSRAFRITVVETQTR